MRRIALCGNPNAGKTTLFNKLTGLNLHTGNYNGVTVDAAEFMINDSVMLVDLPGVFSLDAQTEDEMAAAEYLKNEATELIAVIDGTCPKRTMPLLCSLLRLKLPSAVVITMNDIMKVRSMSVDTGLIKNALGIPVLLSSDTDALRNLIKSGKFAVPTAISEKSLDSLISNSFTGISVAHLYAFDKWLLGSNAALLAAPAALLLPIYLIFTCISPPLSKGLTVLFDCVSDFVIRTLHFLPGRLLMFIDGGVLGGIGSVLVFISPVILTFIYLIMLEESGIMARLSAISSHYANKCGISGRCIISFMLGFGCTVPAIYSLRTSDKETASRTSIVLPFFQCSAKLPLYLAFAQYLFAPHGELVILFVYSGGVAAAFFSVIIMNKIKKTPICDAIIELPSYKVPVFSTVLRSVADKCVSIIRKTSTAILFTSCIVWVLSHFDVRLHFIESTSCAVPLLEHVCSFISPIFAPLGFGNSTAVTSLICGFAAKEAVISSLTVQIGRDGLLYALPALFTKPAAMAFLTFYALYPPCISSASAYYNEFGISHMIKTVLFQFAIAFVFSYAVYNLLLFVL